MYYTKTEDERIKNKMENPQLSLIVPSIRPSMYQGVYDSFLQCWHGTFEIIFVCPHKPIHEAMKRDIKNFEKIYAKPNDRINIPLDNWERTSEVWKERFK